MELRLATQWKKYQDVSQGYLALTRVLFEGHRQTFLEGVFLLIHREEGCPRCHEIRVNVNHQYALWTPIDSWHR